MFQREMSADWMQRPCTWKCALVPAPIVLPEHVPNESQGIPRTTTPEICANEHSMIEFIAVAPAPIAIASPRISLKRSPRTGPGEEFSRSPNPKLPA